MSRTARQPAVLGADLWFPDPRDAPGRGDLAGLVAVGGDLSVSRLLLAYRSGIFPWSAEPVTWWSPARRGVFDLEDMHWPRRLRQVIAQNRFRVTRNTAFAAVITACATQPRRGGWLSGEFIQAYTALHQAGHAHSVECWRGDELVGGVYGVTCGGLFAGESMFHTVTNASKVALFHLAEHLRRRNFALFDIQMVTPTTRQFGAREIPRAEYLARLEDAIHLERVF